MLLLKIRLQKKKNKHCTCNLTQSIVYAAPFVISIVPFKVSQATLYTPLIKQERWN